MRKTMLVCVILLFAAETQAQEQRNAAYFELGGSAIVPSINYERRLSERVFGRIGASYIVGETTEDTETTFVIPLTLSWISHPASNHHFEAGGGVTIATGDSQDLLETVDDDRKFSKLFVTGIAGYRYQKPGRGFQFRAALTPIFADGELLPWFGLSVGYAW